MNPQPTEDFTSRLFVCCGYVTLDNGKPGIAIAEVQPEAAPANDQAASELHIQGAGDLVRVRIHERKVLRPFMCGQHL